MFIEFVLGCNFEAVSSVNQVGFPLVGKTP